MAVDEIEHVHVNRGWSGGALIFAALLVGAGLLAGGLLAGKGFERSRLGDRFVTVKGLAEREVEADQASWPLTFTVTGDELSEVQGRVEAGIDTIRTFLVAQGFPDEEITVGDLRVNDLLAQPWRSERVEGSRFILAQVVLVRSRNPARVAATSRLLGELVRQGIVLQEGSVPRYAFTRLNEVKPGMIAEATKAARKGAEQFAADAGSRVGGIRRANQGVVSIEPRDPSLGSEDGQLEKRVRVVVTLDYFLSDGG